MCHDGARHPSHAYKAEGLACRRRRTKRGRFEDGRKPSPRLRATIPLPEGARRLLTRNGKETA
jgi:hypothetical protein